MTTQQKPNKNNTAKKSSAAPANGNGTTRTVTQAQVSQAAQANAEKAARREADLAARAERRAKAEAAAKRQKQTRTMIGGGLALLAVAALVVIYMWQQDANPGESFTDQGNNHVALGAVHPDYNSEPPTSGWHTDGLAPWGIQTTAPATEQLIHNLEDGGVVIYYRPDIDSATLDKLETYVSANSGHLVLTPREGLSDPIVATAWTRLQRFATFDEATLSKFVNRYKGIDHHVAGQG